ncbi:hypothetical protein GKC29_25305 [Micromonospora sp. WMMC415]|uniref:hypothetical protein n=1 Tax=Micromonospora sp. WMMC415 TaxID=2675222 RepID=UPI0012B4C2B4|nr:hypothetical protein [Micromonospora sp. WMMC415]QGN49814.1 hypothetical protein GKC29_25305 [Micromonospora sp. WMMC415]
MTSSVWLHRDEDFHPGTELFRSERLFALWSYSATHGQLLLRADHMPGDDRRLPTTVEVLFKPIEAVRMQGGYRGLVIRCATDDEAAEIEADIAGHRPGSARVLMLESEGVTGYAVTLAVGWSEGVLSRLQPSLFNTFRPYDPVWPTKPLAGVGAELDTASPQEVAEAVLAGMPKGIRRERRATVYVLTAVIEQDGRRSRHNVGVFLTESDAEEALRLVEPHVRSCWVEPLPTVL